MSQLRRSTFVAMTLTVLERFSRNSAGRMLLGRGTSSREEKSNKQGTSRIRLMQALVNTDFKTGKPERLTRMTVHNIYKVPANVPAKSPGKLTAQFKPMTLNSSPNCIPVRNWLVMCDSSSNNPHAVSILCLSTGIYHNGGAGRLGEMRWKRMVRAGRV